MPPSADFIEEFQSTLPRGERHVVGIPLKDIWDFNPRSHEGSDSSDSKSFHSSIYFNPRSHEGSDIIPKNRYKNRYISIHAPTRGATSHSIATNDIFHISIHAPTRGATKIPRNKLPVVVFQSTLPRGERQCTDCFCKQDVQISIHAPTRGATGREHDKYIIIDISIHAPTRGATAIFAKKFSFLSAKIV